MAGFGGLRLSCYVKNYHFCEFSHRLSQMTAYADNVKGAADLRFLIFRFFFVNLIP
jgi:hypothetical protein